MTVSDLCVNVKMRGVEYDTHPSALMVARKIILHHTSHYVKDDFITLFFAEACQYLPSSLIEDEMFGVSLLEAIAVIGVITQDTYIRDKRVGISPYELGFGYLFNQLNERIPNFKSKYASVFEKRCNEKNDSFNSINRSFFLYGENPTYNYYNIKYNTLCSDTIKKITYISSESKDIACKALRKGGYLGIHLKGMERDIASVLSNAVDVIVQALRKPKGARMCVV